MVWGYRFSRVLEFRSYRFIRFVGFWDLGCIGCNRPFGVCWYSMVFLKSMGGRGGGGGGGVCFLAVELLGRQETLDIGPFGFRV